MFDENEFLRVAHQTSSEHPRHTLNAMGLAQKAGAGAVPNEDNVKMLVVDLVKRGILKFQGTFPSVVLTNFGKEFARSLG